MRSGSSGSFGARALRSIASQTSAGFWVVSPWKRSAERRQTTPCGTRAAADLDVVFSRGGPRFVERAMDAVDEDELCAAFHLHGRAAVVRENEDGHVVGWVLAPPTLPAFVRPGPAHRSEHVAPQDPRADVGLAACGEVVVYARGATLLAVGTLPTSRGN